MSSIGDALKWEAAQCTACGATVVHELKRGSTLADGDECPCCHRTTLVMVRNPSLVMGIVLATMR